MKTLTTQPPKLRSKRNARPPMKVVSALLCHRYDVISSLSYIKEYTQTHWQKYFSADFPSGRENVNGCAGAELCVKAPWKASNKKRLMPMILKRLLRITKRIVWGFFFKFTIILKFILKFNGNILFWKLFLFIYIT